MIAEPVKQTVRIGRDPRRRERNQRTQRRRLAFEGKSVEQVLVDVSMERGVVLQQIVGGFDRDRRGRTRDLQLDGNVQGYVGPNFHILRIRSKSADGYRQVVRVERNVGESELARSIGGGGTIVSADGIVNLNRGLRDDGTGGIDALFR